MKVVYDPQIFLMQKVGGIARYFVEIATRIASSQSAQVSIFAQGYINEYLRALKDAGIIIGFERPDLPKTTKIAEAINAWTFQNWVNRHKIDIVHETYFQYDYSQKPHTKHVTTIYDFIDEKYHADRCGEQVSASKSKAILRADHIICISENTKKDLLERFNLAEETVSVVHLGCSLRKEYEEQPGGVQGPFILYVGTRYRYKNFEGCLKAYGLSAQLQRDFSLVCFGGGPFTAEEIRLMQEMHLNLDKVKQLRGSDNLLANLYSRAACMVYPSFYEGFGLPVLEAMSFDCPVVCSSSSSLPEVAGDAAAFFDPQSVEAIQSTLERILYSEREKAQMRDRGRARAALFSWDACAEKTAAIYARAIAGRD